MLLQKHGEELKKRGEVYCLGELVHNNQVTEELISKGVKFIDNIDEAKGNIIIRSHGVEKKIYDEAKKLNIEVIDLTCPKVLYTHKLAEKYCKNGYYIFITGKSTHPEIVGTASFCGKNYCIIEKEEDVEKAVLKFKNTKLNKAIMISQTTFSMEKFNNIKKQIINKIGEKNIEIINTICQATKQRQKETENIAKHVDTMIIVGGKHSSNSNKLFELAKKHCKNVLFLEKSEELLLEELQKSNIIGVMAGASTPEESIEKVVEKINKI